MDGTARAGSITITVDTGAFQATREARERLRMLALLPAPVADAKGDKPPQHAHLDLLGEWQRLHSALEWWGARAPWAVARLWPPTLEALGDVLSQHGPGYQVVHVGSHGGPHGLWLEDHLGREVLAPVEKLVDIFRDSPVELVVLNACKTETVARALVERARIPAVVATHHTLADGDAKLLAERLYRRLALGDSVGQAVAAFRESLAQRLGDPDYPLGWRESREERLNNVFVVGDPNHRLTLPPYPADAPLFAPYAAQLSADFRHDLVQRVLGRHRELICLARWLTEESRSFFGLSGVGGVGKTTLALAAALRHNARFQAVVFASAKDNPDFGPIEVQRALTATLGIPPEPGRPPQENVVRLLNQHRVLLILDNLETVRADRAQELAWILERVDPHRGSRVLLTLRPRQKDPLTRLVPSSLHVDALPLEAAQELAWEEVVERCDWTQAQQLLQRYAGSQAIWNAHQAGARKLAQDAFHHPALVRLAASLLVRHGPQATATRLRRLAGRDVEAALEEFIGAMVTELSGQNPRAVAILWAASVFSAPAPHSLLQQVALDRTGRVEDDEAAIAFDDDLQAGVDAALLDRVPMPPLPPELARLLGEQRYTLPPPVRGYLQKSLHSSKSSAPRPLAAMRLRLAQALIPVMEANDKAWLESRISLLAVPEWENLTGIWDWLAQASVEDEEAAQVLLAHARHWRNLLVLVAAYDPRSEKWLTAALEAARRLGDRLGQANTLKAMGDVRRYQDDYDQALELYEQALELFHAVGDRLGQANTLASLSRLALVQGRNREAQQLLEQAVAIRRAIGDRYGVAADWGNFGIVLCDLGRREEARPYLLQAAEIFEVLGLHKLAAYLRGLAGAA